MARTAVELKEAAAEINSHLDRMLTDAEQAGRRIAAAEKLSPGPGPG